MVSHSRIHAKLSPTGFTLTAVSYVCEVVTWGGSYFHRPQQEKEGFFCSWDPLINFMDIITLIYQ